MAAILAVMMILFSITLFLSGLAAGIFLPLYIPHEFYFLIWDVFIALFLFVWVVHVATELQRSDAITLDRILHLPVSLAQVFAVNYFSSWVNIHLIGLCGVGIGFVLGSCFSMGPGILLVIIPFTAFILALTALTYQVQGWLAAMMANPRRRQLIMVLFPIVIIAMSQLPTLVATRFAKTIDKGERQSPIPAPPVVVPQAPPTTEARDAETIEKDVEQPPSLEGSSVDPLPSPAPEKDEDSQAIAKQQQAEARNERRKKSLHALTENMRLANLFFPPLWLGGCVDSIVQGTYYQALLLTIAMFGIAWLSLRRNYHQTLRYYQGASSSESHQSNVSIAPDNATHAAESKVRMVEWQLPGLSETTSAIVTMTWQSMKRAPEVKIYFLLPFIAPIIMFAMLRTVNLPKIDELKAAIVVGLSSLSLFLSTGIVGNQFGFDRAGFRAFVLSPIRRDRILLGRNIASALILLLQILFIAVAMSLFFGLAWDKVLGAVLLSASILPMFGVMVNLMSIYAPFPIAAGSMQPKHFDLIPTVLSLVLSMLMPFFAVAGVLPLGIEWVAKKFVPMLEHVPISLVLSAFWVTGSLALYRWALPYQGEMLAKREKELLRIVTSKIE